MGSIGGFASLLGTNGTTEGVCSTYVHSYSFHRSTHSNGSGQITFAHGLFDGQPRSKFRAIVACPHCVPFIAGGSGRCFPSNLKDHPTDPLIKNPCLNYHPPDHLPDVVWRSLLNVNHQQWWPSNANVPLYLRPFSP